MISKIFKYTYLSGALIITVLIIQKVFGGATVEQMNATGAMMRNACLPKFPKVSKEIADGIKIGNIPDEKDAKCYINCILEMMQSIKKGKFLYESSLKQVDLLLPEEYKDEYRVGLTACKNSVVGIKNNCDAAYALLTCLRNEIQRFVFP